ncbi:MAG: Gfo/Idh/MocA family oxidoreductase [Gemmatimonadetes bacterium]|nr:Gfo/Idh/MocA family oxidoreductase [Gemmatimonadota bacterium]
MDYRFLSSGFAQGGASANDKIVLAMIGVGAMGKNRLNGFLEHPDVEISAICDVDARHVEEGIALVRAKRGRTPKAFRDFRDVLDEPDVDAVVVVTPDHWHALPTVRACEAGKDVFVEKPLSFSVAEGRAMVDAAARHRRVTQMGNHIHNDVSNYRRVVERVKSGQLGRVTRVHLWKASTTQGRGNPPDAPPPRELDYDLWLGVAPRRPYNPLRSHLSWRYFWDYSGGELIDFWCHISDVAFWALDLKAPETVSAIGGRYHLDDGTETPDTVEAQLAFPGLNYVFRLHPRALPGFEHMGSIGCVFEGTDATLVTSYNRHEVYVAGKKVEDMPAPSLRIPDSPGHLREFLDAIKARKLDTTCNVAYGHQLTKPGLLANIALRTGTTLRWDDQREAIVGNPEAQRLLTDSTRHAWTLRPEPAARAPVAR